MTRLLWRRGLLACMWSAIDPDAAQPYQRYAIDRDDTWDADRAYRYAARRCGSPGCDPAGPVGVGWETLEEAKAACEADWRGMVVGGGG